MSAYDHTSIVAGCYRCDLNKDEMPTPLEAAAAVIYDGPASFPSDTTTAREAIEAALDAADLEKLTFRHRRLESDMWHCACGVRVHNVADHSNHQAAMIRAALLGAS
jgi:hypothetical protein